jgi:hypothetical protein
METEIQKRNTDMPAPIEDETEMRIKIQNFQRAFLQREPRPEELQKNKFANDSLYLPISFLEMTLDEIFFGLWQTRNFTTRTIANEVVGEIELWVFHPTAKTWMCRIGAGAVQVQMVSKEKGGSGDIGDISQKIVNTLTKDYPHLKAECFRNACLSLGKTFGRDLNRKFDDQYSPIIKEVKAETDEEQKKHEEKQRILDLSKSIIDALAKYKGADLDKIKTECAKKLKDNTATVEYLETTLKKVSAK